MDCSTDFSLMVDLDGVRVWIRCSGVKVDCIGDFGTQQRFIFCPGLIQEVLVSSVGYIPSTAMVIENLRLNEVLIHLPQVL